MKYISAVVVIIVLFGLALARKNASIDLISVAQLIPQNDANLLSLITLFEEGELDFWRAPSKVGSTVDIMVNSKQRKFLETFASKHQIPFKIIVNDLNKLIAEKEGGDEQNSWTSRALKRLNGGRRDLGGDVTDNRKDDFGLSMKDYHSYSDIVSWMNRIESRLPGQAKVFSIGRTVEGRETYGIKVKII
uniref:Carboxypeptidase activation peptide domain-containing protein n=1 Tax=Panagrolaimus sp. ES5 TaxID=591445 RepID=A0AC34FQI1_9BILA